MAQCREQGQDRGCREEAGATATQVLVQQGAPGTVAEAEGEGEKEDTVRQG